MALLLLVVVLGRASSALSEPLVGPGGSIGAALLGIGVLVGGAILAESQGLGLPMAVVIGLLTVLVVLIESRLYGASFRTLVLSWAIALGFSIFAIRLVGAGFDFFEFGTENRARAVEGHPR